MTAEEWAALDLPPDVGAQLTAEASVAARTTPGGPAPESVKRQLAALRSALEE